MERANLPKCVVLETSEGEHLGFLLLALAMGATRGECVFVILPTNARLSDLPIVRSLFARKDLGESKVEVIPGPPTRLHITSGDLPRMVVELGGQGVGTWRELSPGTSSGRAAVPENRTSK